MHNSGGGFHLTHESLISRETARISRTSLIKWEHSEVVSILFRLPSVMAVPYAPAVLFLRMIRARFGPPKDWIKANCRSFAAADCSRRGAGARASSHHQWDPHHCDAGTKQDKRLPVAPDERRVHPGPHGGAIPSAGGVVCAKRYAPGLRLWLGQQFAGWPGAEPDSTLVLLTHTNVAAPLGQWQPILTYQFDSFGTLSRTNLFNTAEAQRYFIIQQNFDDN